MKGLVCALVLGLASAAGAEEVEWRAVRPEQPLPTPLVSCVTIGRPRPLPESAFLNATAIPGPAAVPPRVVRLSAELPDSAVPVVSPPAPPSPDVWGTFAPSADGAPGADVLGLHDAFEPGQPQFYARAEYLMWWFKEARLPPLVTTGPNEPNGMSAILGMPGTVVLFGGSGAGGDVRSGARLTVGAWLDEDCGMGVEASGFFIGQRSYRFTANSNEFPVLARPFFNLNAMTESAQEATTPGRSVGRVSVGGPSSLWGADIDLRCNLCCGDCGRLDFLAGPRYVQLDERLQIQESLLGLAGAGSFAGSRIQVTDRFDTRNQFFGAQLGLDYRLNRGPWSLDLLGKLALGESHEVVGIAGNQVVVSSSGSVTTANGGLLALPTNSGQFTRDRFAVLPELGATLGWQVTDWCRLSAGFSFLYWSSVVRPGDQIDRVLDVTQVPNFMSNARPTGIPRPTAMVRDTDFWAQGINFGVEFRY